MVRSMLFEKPPATPPPVSQARNHPPSPPLVPQLFEKPPRDVASTLPARYKAPSFMCSALQQSRPSLSWDADDSERGALMKRDLSKAELRELDYSSYLASDSADGSSAEEEW